MRTDLCLQEQDLSMEQILTTQSAIKPASCIAGVQQGERRGKVPIPERSEKSALVHASEKHGGY